jgi:hypothetical protein
MSNAQVLPKRISTQLEELRARDTTGDVLNIQERPAMGRDRDNYIKTNIPAYARDTHNIQAGDQLKIATLTDCIVIYPEPTPTDNGTQPAEPDTDTQGE